MLIQNRVSFSAGLPSMQMIGIIFPKRCTHLFCMCFAILHPFLSDSLSSFIVGLGDNIMNTALSLLLLREVAVEGSLRCCLLIDIGDRPKDTVGRELLQLFLAGREQ